MVKVSVDGACSRNGTPEARAGYGIWWHHPEYRHLNRSKRVRGPRQTNEVAEIQAATKAIKIAIQNDFRRLEIRADNRNLIKSATEWIYGWRENGWITSTGTGEFFQ